mmetsp:Transcript_18544/g.27928  ORF Transcript_18544/g.27928 Transcript_18544/m.27928 type:complete len:465 (-) Transcript_18544:298-1692(-)
MEEKKKKKKGGNRITRELIRKRAEHNESIISTLEELSLHQEEISKIDPILGSSCRKIKILYLQNNIISKIENLHHMKDLEYLNVALNNIRKIEGLGSCEFLNKLDLTCNFIDVDELETSIAHLKDREHLRELYMIGNPAQNEWDGFQNYIIHQLPQLQRLDGHEISLTMRIMAKKQAGFLCLQLRELAEKKRIENAAKTPLDPSTIDTDASAPYTPEVRTAMYEEMAEQKDEEIQRKIAMQPRERDYADEQKKAISDIRSKEEKDAQKIMQCNQGNWTFHFDEDKKPGYIILEVHVQRHLDSSLIDLDVHPNYLSIIIKSKTLRLKLPYEVKASESFAQRSKASGFLVVNMPKVDPDGPAIFSKANRQLTSPHPTKSGLDLVPRTTTTTTTTQVKQAKENNNPRVIRKKAKPSLASVLLTDANLSDEEDQQSNPTGITQCGMTAIRTTALNKSQSATLAAAADQ